MRIVINDFSGHPFQVQLSRELASRGHDVLHLYFADFVTPKGDLLKHADDPPNFAVRGITLGVKFVKTDLIRRRFREIRYAEEAVRVIGAFAPDVVVGCNNPLDAQNVIQRFCAGNNIKFLFWLQDLYSIAITDILRRKFSFAGRLVGLWYRLLERRLLRNSDGVIAISQDFLAQLEAWSVPTDRVQVIPNWAPLDAISPRPKRNPWSELHGLADSKSVFYTGTLGFKHNPGLLLELAERVRNRPDVRIVVISEGQGAEFLKAEKASRRLDNLVLLPFQPIEDYSDVLGSADVLVSIIEPEAGGFSVPSKVLSYLCGGRAMVLSVPLDNLAAKTVVACGAGVAVPPGQADQFVRAVQGYIDNPEAASAAGRNARAYAEDAFDIKAIGDRFERIFRGEEAGPTPGTLRSPSVQSSQDTITALPQ